MLVRDVEELPPDSTLLEEESPEGFRIFGRREGLLNVLLGVVVEGSFVGLYTYSILNDLLT